MGVEYLWWVVGSPCRDTLFLEMEKPRILESINEYFYGIIEWNSCKFESTVHSLHIWVALLSHAEEDNMSIA